jgi:hypothetical protein
MDRRPPQLSNTSQFLLLPGELRNLIYTFYFEDAGVTGPKPQRQSKHATALLFVSRQIYAEAADVMYKTATFSISLGKDYAPLPQRDVVWMYENENMTADDWCSVQSQTLQRFHNVQLKVDRPGGDSKADNYRYAFPMLVSYLTELQVGQHVRVMLNAGRLNQQAVFSSPEMSRWKLAFADISFSKSRKSHKGNKCTDECTSECKRHNFEERATAAQTLADLSGCDLEACCIVQALVTLGQNARFSGAEFFVEDCDGEREHITADNPVDLIGQAEGLDKGNDLWVVLEGCWGGYFV